MYTRDGEVGGSIPLASTENNEKGTFFMELSYVKEIILASVCPKGDHRFPSLVIL